MIPTRMCTPVPRPAFGDYWFLGFFQAFSVGTTAFRGWGQFTWGLLFFLGGGWGHFVWGLPFLGFGVSGVQGLGV